MPLDERLSPAYVRKLRANAAACIARQGMRDASDRGKPARAPLTNKQRRLAKVSAAPRTSASGDKPLAYSDFRNAYTRDLNETRRTHATMRNPIRSKGAPRYRSGRVR